MPSSKALGAPMCPTRRLNVCTVVNPREGGDVGDRPVRFLEAFRDAVVKAAAASPEGRASLSSPRRPVARPRRRTAAGDAPPAAAFDHEGEVEVPPREEVPRQGARSRLAWKVTSQPDLP